MYSSNFSSVSIIACTRILSASQPEKVVSYMVLSSMEYISTKWDVKLTMLRLFCSALQPEKVGTHSNFYALAI